MRINTQGKKSKKLGNREESEEKGETGKANREKGRKEKGVKERK